MNPNPAHLANDPASRDAGATIDRALSIIREAEPRPGLNTRILAAIEQRAATPQPARLAFSAHIALWSATFAAIIALTSLIILHHRPTTVASTQNTVILSGAQRAQSKDPDTARSTTNPETFSTTNLALATARPAIAESTLSNSRHPEQSEAARRAPVFGCADHPHSGCPIHDGTTVVSGETTTADLDAQALADFHAPSHPAPPLPLTPQEKLFLRMYRNGNETLLAELNPIIRAKQDADEAAAFKSFFPEPPPLKQPGDNE